MATGLFSGLNDEEWQARVEAWRVQQERARLAREMAPVVLEIMRQAGVSTVVVPMARVGVPDPDWELLRQDDIDRRAMVFIRRRKPVPCPTCEGEGTVPPPEAGAGGR